MMHFKQLIRDNAHLIVEFNNRWYERSVSKQ